MKLLKHENNTDVAIQILSSEEVFLNREGKGSLPGRAIKVQWWNIIAEKPFPIPDTAETIFIPYEEWDKWKPWPRELTERERCAYTCGPDTLAGNDRDL